MAENNTDPKAAKLQKEIEQHNKKAEACQKQLDKIGAQSKKALQAAKKIDEIWK